MMESTMGLDLAFLVVLGVGALVMMALIAVAVALVVVARRRREDRVDGASSESMADTALQAHQRLTQLQSQVERMEDALMDELKQE